MAIQRIALDPPADTSTPAILLLSSGPSSSAAAAQTIATPSDHDWFRIDLRAGELYQFSVDSRLSFLDSTLAVRSASGALLVVNDDGNLGSKPTDAALTFRPAASGTFYLDVGGRGTSTGDYNITTREVPADASTYSSIDVHQTIRGDIQSQNDHDWHRIQLVAGQRYAFSVAGNGVGNTIGDPTLSLRDSAGRQLAFNDDFGGSRNARIDFTARSSGVFYLDVGGAIGRTGSYTLSA